MAFRAFAFSFSEGGKTREILTQPKASVVGRFWEPKTVSREEGQFAEAISSVLLVYLNTEMTGSSEYIFTVLKS